MQQRPIVYDLEQIRSFDTLNGWVDNVIGDANGLQVVLGATGTVISNLVVSPTVTPSLTLNISNGFIAQLEPVDQSSYGSLPANTQQVLQLGANLVNSVAIDNSGLSSGQAQYVLIEAGFQQQDAIAASDPNGGVLPYVNISNPSSPFYGPGNSGISQDTVRNAVCNIQVKYGTPATAGSEVPPANDAGYVSVAYVDLAYGQVSITGGEILNPNNVVGGTDSPVLAGLLNSHHNGIPGQAPQIILTAGSTSEVQGELPTANMVASNSTGAVSTWRNGSGNPNGNVAGNANTNGAADEYYDVTNLLLYVCTTTGSSSTAVWTSVAAPLPSNLLFFGNGATGALSNTRPLPTSGTVSGEYYIAGNWVQTGALTVTEGRFFFGGNATFNNTVTVVNEMAGGQAGAGDNTTAGIGQDGAGLGGGQGGGGGNSGSTKASGGGGGGGHGGSGGSASILTTDGVFGGFGGQTYPLSSLLTGSGGGGGGGPAISEGAGGNGGGALYIEAVGSVTFASGTNLTLNGSAGGSTSVNESYGGGGGSGGGLQVRSIGTVTIASGATIAANGGAGGTTSAELGGAGGGGGGGVVDLSGSAVTNNGTINVTGGAAGASSGDIYPASAGSDGIVNLNNFVLGRRAPN